MEKEEFELFFEKSKVERLQCDYIDANDTLGANLSDEDYDIAIIGIPSSYGSESWNAGTESAPDFIRKYLYSLSYSFPGLKVSDLGDVVAKDAESLTCALVEIVTELEANDKKYVFIGGSKCFLLPIMQGISSRRRDINFVLADSVVDFSPKVKDDDGVFIPTYLDEIISMDSVKNVDVLGYQNYFLSKSRSKFVDHRWIEITRLAALQESVASFEPVLRDSDIFAINARVIRFSDCPAVGIPSPNGLYGNEACYLAKLAGTSDRNSGFGLFELNPTKDLNEVSAHLSAQIVWHYLQGVANRIGDYPLRSLSDYQKYIVFDPPTKTEINFYENQSNGRWWVEIPMKSGKTIYSCTRSDYETFLNREVPRIWYRHFMK